jgi:hypothetical protein
LAFFITHLQTGALFTGLGDRKPDAKTACRRLWH